MERTNFTCTVAGCNAPAKAAGMCNPHYRRMQRHGTPIGGRVSKGARLKWLQAHVDFAGDDCLVPPFIRNPTHWQFQQDGKFIGAHRWMCERVHGAPPSLNHQAAHSCGKGHLGCVNPGHLRWATPKENNADKIDHGTLKLGSEQPMAKLKEADVVAIKSMLGTTAHSSISNIFGVSRSTITLIANEKTWTHVRTK